MPIHEMLRREWIAAGYKSDMGSAIACPPPANRSTIRLYNLTSVKNAISNIENQRIKVSRFAYLNDPFELLAANFKEHKMRQVVRDWKDKSHSLMAQCALLRLQIFALSGMPEHIGLTSLLLTQCHIYRILCRR